MKKIQQIIAATDLSVTARNAFCYAKALAKTLNATLKIVHVKENFMGSAGSKAPQPAEDHAQLINDIESLMKEEADDIHLITPGQNMEINILTGDPVVVLTGLSESNTTDLIVIGTTGLSDVLTKVVGSTLHLVSNQAHCPVILVPRDAKWKPIEKIVFASNYDSISSELVQNITDFALSVKASIHFVNVKNFDPVFEPKQTDTDWTALSGIDPDLYFEKHTVYGNDAIEQLQQYSEKNGADMIAFVSKHRGFWKSLLHKSVTENIALSTIIPIMVMHVDDGA